MRKKKFIKGVIVDGDRVFLTLTHYPLKNTKLMKYLRSCYDKYNARRAEKISNYGAGVLGECIRGTGVVFFRCSKDK